MGFWSTLAGQMVVELTSADLPGAYSAINARRIPLFSVRQSDLLTAQFTIYRRDYKQLSALAEERSETLKLITKKGVYWSLLSLCKRPVLLCGVTALLILTLFLPTRVLFVRVTGNRTIPERAITEAAENCGIRFGASRRQVRSEKVKNNLLSLLPELKWAGVNTYGCVAVISVTEREIQETADEEGVSSIVACRDGIIEECTVTRGTALCTVGQAVTQGQTLISGYTDCGITILATRAQGEVYAQTIRQISAVTPASIQVKTGITETEYRFSLLLGKKRINLWKGSGIYQGSCDRMYQEYRITLPGGFQLPIALAVEEITYYTSAEQLQPSQEEMLTAFAEKYLSEQMTAGTILERDASVSRQQDVWLLEGRYVCREMIGREIREQIGVEHGKNSRTNGQRGAG